MSNLYCDFIIYSMLEFRNISKVFTADILKKPFQALEDVTFKIPENSVMGFLGANGAGKTTSIKIAMDFIRPSSGEVIFHQSLGGSRSNALKKMGYLPERPFFYPHLTGREFCTYMGLLAEVPKTKIKEQINYWSPRFKIEFALDREIKTYSKGMLQRLGFLVTLLHNPKLIILDEPLSGLDPIGRTELKEIITEVNSQGTTVFFSSHIVSDVEAICDKVVFMRSGNIIFDGDVDKVISDHSYGKSKISYLGNDKINHIEVEDSDKNNKIKALINDGHSIIAVEPKKLSLEEIFYNVR